MNLRKVGCDPGDWIDIAEDSNQWRAFVRAVMNLRVPWKPISYVLVDLIWTYPNTKFQWSKSNYQWHNELNFPMLNKRGKNKFEKYIPGIILKIKKWDYSVTIGPKWFQITNLNDYRLETLRNMILVSMERVSMERETQIFFMLSIWFTISNIFVTFCC